MNVKSAKRKAKRAKKVFAYGDVVWVKLPGRSGFTGEVYSVDRVCKGKERRIYVEESSGCGVAHLVRYVRHLRSCKRSRSVR
jgi:hypothetical protein